MIISCTLVHANLLHQNTSPKEFKRKKFFTKLRTDNIYVYITAASLLDIKHKHTKT